MPKAKHRKRVRAARVDAARAPIATEGHATNGNEPAAKKVGKKEAEVTAILDKLRSADAKERIQGSSALSSMLLNLPPVTLRLLLAKNLIGLLIERLNDSEDEVVVESLGALRNLAVSSPLSLLSEMHNKRLLLPITSKIIPLLMDMLPSMLQPASSQPSQSSSTSDRKKHEDRQRLYWDWAENTLTLIWCLAESNTKILSSLNAQPSIVPFCTSFLTEKALALDGTATKGKKKEASKVARVPLYVAVAASQALFALLSANPPAQHALASQSVPPFLTILGSSSPAGSPIKTDSHHATSTSDAEDWETLRVLSFGTLLELSTTSKRFRYLRDEIKPFVPVLQAQTRFDLTKCVDQLESLAAKDDPTSLPNTDALSSYERRLSTLQLALEVLSEYFASLDSLSMDELEAEEDEEWQGIVDDDGDAEMASDDDEEVILQKPRPGEDEEAIMTDGEPVIQLPDEDLSVLTSLPAKLLELARPTKLSFLPPQTTVVTNTSSLVPTSATETQAIIPASFVPLADTITLVHVRALECANNLFITLGRSVKEDSVLWKPDWQNVFEQTLELVRGAASTVGQVGQERDGTDRKDEMREDEERKLELVMAGTGVVWGIARLGLNQPEQADLLNVAPVVSSFLVELFDHAFARLLTPAGEAIRVRILGALGCVGRRAGVTPQENALTGDLLLSVMPRDKESSPLSPTIDVLLQAIDSLIDIYADEESSYDVEVFRKRGYLARLDAAVPGVRAACKKIDRKRFPAQRGRADGAVENLVAFTAYRRDFE